VEEAEAAEEAVAAQVKADAEDADAA